MSSHHVQSLSDPNYLLRLQNIRIADESMGSTLPSNRRTNSLNGTVGAIESIANDIGHNGPAMTMANRISTNDYKLYDRNNIISASKLSSSKLNETLIAAQQHQLMQSQGGKLSGMSNNSPTHSLSGSSQHSGSPRTSLVTGGGVVGVAYLHSGYHDPQRTIAVGPVYENIEYYGSTAPTQSIPYNHYGIIGNNNNSGSGGTYEIIGKKLDSAAMNGCTLGRFAHTPQPPDVIESTPIYENLSNVSGQRVPPTIASSLKPQKVIYSQVNVNNDTSGTYVQPQLILSQNYRTQSPTHSNASTANKVLLNNYNNVSGDGGSMAIKMQSPHHANVQYPIVRGNVALMGQVPVSYDNNQKLTKYPVQLVRKKNKQTIRNELNM